ncbi:hypothetical protein [Gloeobacter morelensis]|uniref:Uncharacterized protein n=1 Tax=Gloeobacter morelensis MG652769 TaxID=2781736 RepID=A0ABY3PJV9_9CYAN|nr:hypothetical protein [Gloeobacter morelensis]UFP93908.1 hypothetical protein ISF26_19370 [Gloeobacter morelensis MG652769]
MSAEPQSKEATDSQENPEKYTPDLDKIDLDLSGTETAQPNVSPEIIAREEAKEAQVIADYADAQAPDLEFLPLDFLNDQEDEEERDFRVKFRQVVLAGYGEGKSLDEIYTAVDAIERSKAVDTKNLPLHDLAERIYRSAANRSSEVTRCYICGKYNPRYEDSCPTFCPYSESIGQS